MTDINRKRRTMSAADIELGGAYELAPTESPLIQKPRRKSNARQARIVYPPVYQSQMMPMTTPHMPYQQPVYSPHIMQQMMTKSMPLITPLPQPVYGNNSIIFTLYPGMAEISYSLQLDKQPNHIFNLLTSNANQLLTFSINSTMFNNVGTPFDITNFINPGLNNIHFVTLSNVSTIFVELKLTRTQNVDEMVRKIVNEFPPPPLIMSDPFISKVCPISKQDIVQAGRGCKCTHSQCFDIRSYISQAVRSNSWICPVCGQPLPFEEVRYDRDYNPDITFFAQEAFGEDFGDF